MLQKIDLAYTAGIIDGEGCISICKHSSPTSRYRYRYDLRVDVGMCEELIPMWLYMHFGGNLRNHKGRKPSHRPVYHWQIASKQAQHFLELILPYLKTKRPQAELAITFQKGKSVPRGTYTRKKFKPIVVLEAEGVLANKLKELHNGQQLESN